MRICKHCEGEIPESRRAGALYCCDQCQIDAKQKRRAERVLNDLGDENQYFNNQTHYQSSMNQSELRQIEKEHYQEISNLRESYSEKIRKLENQELKDSFKIENLQKEIERLQKEHEKEIKELIIKHEKELREANKSGTKDVVNSITKMPAVQGMLGELASSMIKNPKSNALGSVNEKEEEFNKVEKQIIEGIRRMQQDVQGQLVNTLYHLFAMSHEEQVEIFETLMTFVSNNKSDEEDELP